MGLLIVSRVLYICTYLSSIFDCFGFDFSLSDYLKKGPFEGG